MSSEPLSGRYERALGSGLHLREKYNSQARGQKVVFFKKPVEHLRHVLT
jgi:hypothetical protein